MTIPENLVSTLFTKSTSAPTSAPGYGTYWFSKVSAGTGYTTQAYGVDTDSANNVVVTMVVGSILLTIKYSSTGAIQWQKKLGLVTVGSWSSIAIDSNDNIFIASTVVNATSGNNDILVVKYNSAGTLQWQRSIDGANAVYADYGYGIATDSSGNAYIVGTTGTSSTNYNLLVAKFNTDGAIQWQRLILNIYVDTGYGIAVDNSDNIYVTGQVQLSQGNDIIIAKYNSSGTIQWQQVLASAPGEIAYSIAVDTIGNVYVTGNFYNTSSTDIITVKYNSSGSIQWQRGYGFAGLTDTGWGVATDSNNNVYITGGNGQDMLIIKYDTNGTIQWQRYVAGGSGWTETGKDITVDADGNIYVVGYAIIAGATRIALVIKLPGDGSKVGTFNGYSISATSGTLSVPTLTSSNQNVTETNATLTVNVTTLVPDTAITATVTTVQIP